MAYFIEQTLNSNNPPNKGTILPLQPASLPSTSSAKDRLRINDTHNK